MTDKMRDLPQFVCKPDDDPPKVPRWDKKPAHENSIQQGHHAALPDGYVAVPRELLAYAMEAFKALDNLTFLEGLKNGCLIGTTDWGVRAEKANAILEAHDEA